ncbi:hypothetical protein ACYATO_07145 [Lactobacillaceae bacterium Melli_B3]
MISYAEFLFKRFFKNKMNIGLILAIPLLVVLTMITCLNLNNDAMQRNLDQMGYHQNAQESYKKLAANNINIIKDSHSSSVSTQLMNDNNLLNYLYKHHLPYESTSNPTTSVTLIQKLGDDYMMGLTLLVVIFILINIFASSYADKVRLTSLLPIGPIKTSVVNIIFGIIIYSGVILISVVTSIITGLLGHGLGNLSYPIASYLTNWEIGDYINIRTVLIPMFVIQLLFIIFMVLLAYYVVSVLKDKLNSLFIILIITFGPLITVYFFRPISQLAQWIPVSFFNSINIVTLRLGNSINNYQLNYAHGIISLSVAIVILAFIVIIQNYLQRNNKI